MTRKFSRNSLEDAFEELANLRKKVDELTNRKETTLPFRDVNHLPPGVEGQVVLADYVPPDIVTSVDGMIFLGYRTSGDFYQSVFWVASDDSSVIELLAGDPTTGSLEYKYAKWSTDRSKVYASMYVDSSTFQMWSVNPDGSSPTMIMELDSLSGYQSPAKISFKDTLAHGLKVIYCDSSSPANIKLYDVPAGTSTTIFTTSALPSPYTNHRVARFQWNPDGDKLSFRGFDGSNYVGVFTMNIDGTGLQGPILTTAAGTWWSSTNILVYTGDSSLNIVSTINPDGTSQADLTSYECSEGHWSPDGTKIAFVRYSDLLIKIMNADGTGLVSVPSSDIGSDLGNNRITWSPDGSKIARISADETTQQMKIIDVASATVLNTYSISQHFITNFYWDAFTDYGEFF